MNFPDFSYEKKLWRQGFKSVIGLDEVGRGAFAGPVTVAAVVFSNSDVKGLEGLNDSKLLKPRFRQKLSTQIKDQAIAAVTVSVQVSVINRLGIGKATQAAMRKSVAQLMEKLKYAAPFFLLVDAFYVSYLPSLGKKYQLAIKKGDQKSFSIAAASVLAKVDRDRLMGSLGRLPQFRSYGWGRNKGYGTKQHRQALKKYGPTRLHRKAFIKSWL